MSELVAWIDTYFSAYSWQQEALHNFIRFFLCSALLYSLFYLISPGNTGLWKIQVEGADKKMVLVELFRSIRTLIIYAIVGRGIFFLHSLHLSRIYTSINEYGYLYLIASLVLMVILHDTYFYWTHRLMHHPKIFRVVHQTHHESHNPSPWGAFSFSPLEALVQVGIVPLVVFTIPCHMVTLFCFWLLITIFTVFGHLGYEIFKPGFIFTKWAMVFNSSTHHNMHHSHGKGNYSMYFNIWDRVMHTNNKEYENYSAKVGERKRAGKK